LGVSWLRYPEGVGGVPGGLNQKTSLAVRRYPIFWGISGPSDLENIQQTSFLLRRISQENVMQRKVPYSYLFITELTCIFVKMV